ncbi:hypothetical protein TanjilG_31569 [Lupinus angustifolius]|uniref:Uncharacterized protein n=1 Tax=Lupinus angustifolius TaxID=3871 RepID=A0A1J7GVN0_LUPAN|nr:hypothetical protein TanjilG_31569 [Lupinus angustifolius]
MAATTSLYREEPNPSLERRRMKKMTSSPCNTEIGDGEDQCKSEPCAMPTIEVIGVSFSELSHC